MKITTGYAGREPAIVEPFAGTFAAAEGPKEGALIAVLARDLLAETGPEDIRLFGAEDAGKHTGAAVFTRLTYAEARRVVFLLSPMPVMPGHQRQGIGQALLHHALAALRTEGVDVAITYGYPDYYGRVGFRPIPEGQARAPLPLTLPHGWFGQSLLGDGMPVLRGPSACVPALNRPDVW